MNGRTIRLFPQTGGGSLGLMPVPVNEKPGDAKVELLDKEGAPVAGASIRVVDAHFPKQNVVIEQSLAELKPSPGEAETSTAFRNTVSEVRYWSEPLALPVRGCMTSLFGAQRYLNGKPTGDFHGGLDQRSPAGTPIHAVADGMVKIVRQWNLHGRTVGIDHGQGLESMYLHMSRFAVAEGEPHSTRLARGSLEREQGSIAGIEPLSPILVDESHRSRFVDQHDYAGTDDALPGRDPNGP